MDERELKKHEIGLVYKAFEENKIFQLVEDENGLHQIGGKIPQKH